ncbi:hypothetical protein [Streptomyces sp. WMMC940]|uniref:hypothetical protein n=1 Tax=Streptomyces sp. WMMC940 TaxID=3015153 RepID=UPI0022B6CF95|nr:hypothetical protein [Streptomyces sp. WMMC940]MCZ7456089.1 hypothetical protein [Streptomyces sp. WMMC940]
MVFPTLSRGPTTRSFEWMSAEESADGLSHAFSWSHDPLLRVDELGHGDAEAVLPFVAAVVEGDQVRAVAGLEDGSAGAVLGAAGSLHLCWYVVEGQILGSLLGFLPVPFDVPA